MLLELPEVVRSDTFAYLNPESEMAYQTHIQREEDCQHRLDLVLERARDLADQKELERQAGVHQPLYINLDNNVRVADCAVKQATAIQKEQQKDARTAALPSNPAYNTGLDELPPFDPDIALADMGFLNKVTITEDERETKIIFPDAALYANRGEALKCLTRMEYKAIIEHKKRLEKPSKRSTQFDYGPSFVCHAQRSQFISAKQHTVNVIRKAPPHPGREPAKTCIEQYAKWQEKADRYARYYLILYRPEPACYDSCHVNRYSYTWDALRQFTTELSNDPYFISKVRLMAMHIRMKGFVTTFKTKLMLSRYRGRNRDMWTEQDQQRYAVYRTLEERTQHYDDMIDEVMYSTQHSQLSEKHNRHIAMTLKYSSELKGAFMASDSLAPAAGVSDIPVLPDLSKAGSTCYCFTDQRYKIQEKGVKICNFDKQEETPVDSSFSSQSNYLKSKAYRKKLVQHEKMVDGLYPRQREVYDVYRKYLDDPSIAENKPPPVLFLHGGAGTGKSTVIQCILMHAELSLRHTLRTAFNAINAIHINGQTTASLIHLSPGDSKLLKGLSPQELQQFLDILQKADLILVDEVSNQAPWHLAKFSKVCQQAVGRFDEPFGSIPIIFAGDFIQIGPVRCISLPLATMLMCQHVWCDPIIDAEREAREGARGGRRRDPHVRNTVLADDRYAERHPFNVGASLIRKARLVSMNQQVRTQDPVHTSTVSNLFQGRGTTLQRLRKISLLAKADFNCLGSPWLRAPIVVSTNRERFSLVPAYAIRFATLTGTVVVRWMVNWSRWAQQPSSEYVATALLDDCFYEYFVYDADACINDNICKKLCLVNAQPVRCHSLTLVDEDRQNDLNEKIRSLPPGSVITLDAPPLSYNVRLQRANFSTAQIDAMRDIRIRPNLQAPQPISDNISDVVGQFSATEGSDTSSDSGDQQKKEKHEDDIIIPIIRGRTKWRREVPVYGSANFLPSEVSIKPYFPIDLLFVMTVNKSEGQTMERVILAISHRPGNQKNFDYQALYVALSRVRQGEHNRLLLTGKGESEKWLSLSYIPKLKAPLASLSMLGGFVKKGGDGWQDDVWNPDVAYKSYDRDNDPQARTERDMA